MSNNTTDVSSVLNVTATTMLNLLNETTTTTTITTTTTDQSVPEYTIHRSNFVWPEDPIDEIPVK